MKNAEKGNIKDTLKNVSGLIKYSDSLFYITGSPFTSSAIEAAEDQRSIIARVLG